MLPTTNNDLVFLLQILESISKIKMYSNEFIDAYSFFQCNDQMNFNASLLLIANTGNRLIKSVLN